ncbi:MAG: ATP-dependent DNA helicase PcrA [Deltaproteobacteria bacterium CG_4_10_14_0_2_um_filter_43_8]|nr:MAG: ATP-dependent DNA helicase PcrA [Deltaproteobacteria bacterium CG11_big_fil_rev_8_21_14_0_20_42_23]PJA22193.1 MAG: ATP-dependent DNA helicase PcrA [Deltaproteobacteria bacterium CG_4_10_14_0_2_um_filter_43_8]PJC64459.1 MAG: ATP-dependent DNA helicase PcrA [Deltaproteobacteria bacterium CG_4_9_14_0_2_um_filter_42_21]
MLNHAQNKAVEISDGPLLILAGPGSGKTKTLVHRISRLISENIAFPSHILALTFTNKAAAELRKRCEELIGFKAREVTAGTFHSTCLKLLRKHAEYLGYSSNFVIYDDSDQLTLLKECLAQLNLDQNRLPPRSVLDRISRAKDACLSPEAFEKEGLQNPYLRKISQIYHLYQKRLTELQAMDFGDLIRLTVWLFETQPALCEAYQERWRYLLVDEYQDTNNAQYKLLRLLSQKYKNICVVGDDDQSIYKWRGADVSNILRFEKDFAGAQVVKLEQNYRSTASIIAAAEAVVSRNAGRKSKSLWTENEQGKKVVISSFASDREEAKSVARHIKQYIQEGKSYKEVACFYRTNAQSRSFEEAFREHGIPYKIYGGMKFYARAEVKDILAYLRLLQDSRDDIAFKRILNVPARGIGKTSLEKLELFSQENALSLFDALQPFSESGFTKGGLTKKIQDFHALLSLLRDEAKNLSLKDLVHQVLEKTAYVESLASLGTIEAEAKLENINELVSAIEEFRPLEAENALAEFLDQVALVSEADKIDDDMGAVTLMTLHLAKGLEYPLVYLVGMEEGLFPHARSLDDPEELEEERRLCYVGMTRAMQELHLTHAFRRRVFGKEKYSIPSRFLEEIPAELSERRSAKASTPASRLRDLNQLSHTAGHYAVVEESAVDVSNDFDYDFDQTPNYEQQKLFPKGRKVQHPSFGSGIITQSEKSNAGHKVTVKFQSGMVKRLIAEFAGLVPL